MCRVSVCVHCVQGVMFDLLQGTMFMLNCSQICSQRDCAGDIDEHACTQSSNQHESRIGCVSDTPPLGLPYYPRGTVRPTVNRSVQLYSKLFHCLLSIAVGYRVVVVMVTGLELNGTM
jgi:hypothetical protein